MAVPLQDLDDLTYTELTEEARALIPSLYPDWTDHNPTDPGITLIELFAWLSEMLIYRANRVPDQHLVTFLKLLNGSDWKPGSDLTEDIRTSVVALRRRHRAVTCEDYEALSLEASPNVARAKCVPRRYLGAGTEEDRAASRPGHVSLIIVPDSQEPAPQPSEALRQTVWQYLDPRRLVTTRHHVVGPVYVPVSAEVLIARRPDMPAEGLRDRVVKALQDFLHPLRGGPNGDGWPFRRDIYVSELYELLEGIPGVDFVPDVNLASRCPPDRARCAEATRLWHRDGDLIGLGLAAHHLPQAHIDPERIVISATFVPVRVTIQVTPAESFAPATVRRIVMAAVKRRFHPLHDGPDGQSTRIITIEEMRQLVSRLAQVAAVGDIELQSDPDHLLRDEQGNVIGVRIEVRELADVQAAIVLG